MNDLLTNPTVLAIGAFLAIAGLVGIVALFVNQAEGNKRAENKLDSLVGKKAAKDSSADMLLHQALAGAEKKTILDMIMPEALNLEKIFEQADANIKPSALFGVALALAAVGGALSWLMVGSIYVAPVGGVVFFCVPWVWLFWKRSSRLGAFAAQLPDTMELVARALRAGHSLAAGIHVVAEEMPGPVNKEFARVYEEQNLGIPLEEALKSMCDRVPNLDLRFFATSVIIQRQTGGDLAEILDKIGYVIRERFKILGQVKALTGEGRLSGVVLIALPFGLFLLMMHISYDYVKELWTDPMGIKMSIFALIMQVLGALCIKKIVDIKV